MTYITNLNFTYLIRFMLNDFICTALTSFIDSKFKYHTKKVKQTIRVKSFHHLTLFVFAFDSF